MNTPNPLLPQGILPPRERSTLFFKVLLVIAVHVVVFGGILLQGCGPKPSADKPKTDDLTSASTAPMTPPGGDLPPITPTTPPNSPTTSPLTPPVGTPPALTPSPIAVTPTPAAPPITPAATTGGSVYVVARGDIPVSIAKKNGVTLKALEEANPGIDPKKLKIGQKLQIPAGAATASTETAKPGADVTAAASGDSTIYVVKSGDVLTKIAKAHNTTVKAIEALNDMKTSNIKAGQKLKVPVMKMASAEAAAPAAGPAVPALVTQPPSAPPAGAGSPGSAAR
jgi:LysM repeat protein